MRGRRYEYEDGHVEAEDFWVSETCPQGFFRLWSELMT